MCATVAQKLVDGFKMPGWLSNHVGEYETHTSQALRVVHLPCQRPRWDFMRLLSVAFFLNPVLAIVGFTKNLNNLEFVKWVVAYLFSPKDMLTLLKLSLHCTTP